MVQAPGPTALQSIQQFLQNPVQMFADARTQWGDVVRFAAFGYEFYQVTDPELARIVLSHPQLEMSIMMEHPFVGQGIANNIGESWKNQRRLMQPHFHQRAISGYGEQMVGATQQMLSGWQANTVIEILEPLIRLNHQILGQTILNLDFYEHPALLQALQIIRLYLNRRFQAIFTVPESIPSPRNLAFKRAVKLWNSTINEKIKNAGDDSSLLSMLKQARDSRTQHQMSEKQLRDEINTLFFNGYEDTGVTLTWALYLLTKNPETMKELCDEINQQIGNRLPEVNDLENLPYLDGVLHETMRLYPTTWAIMRDALSDIEIGGYTIPQGSSVQVTVYLLHRHEGYWQEADQFKPERFAGDYPQDAYIPFGSGARQCIGRSFAMMQMKLVLITILQQFCFEFIPQEIVLDGMASLRPKQGLKLGISKAKQA